MIAVVGNAVAASTDIEFPNGRNQKAAAMKNKLKLLLRECLRFWAPGVMANRAVFAGRCHLD